MLPFPAPSTRGSSTLGSYWTFYRAVAATQLNRWLPAHRSRIADLSGARGRWATQAAAAGHQLIQMIHPLRDGPATAGPDGVRQVWADGVEVLGEACVDAVIAEGRVLSLSLATESTVTAITRALRPGGRLLACVDSLVLGMAVLAEQHYWAHLRDHGDVLLIPWPDGTITRCFSAAQLCELLADAGLVVEWIRPRTVLSPSTVEHVLSANPTALAHLVRTELDAQSDDTVGIHLIASARRP